MWSGLFSFSANTSVANVSAWERAHLNLAHGIGKTSPCGMLRVEALSLKELVTGVLPGLLEEAEMKLVTIISAAALSVMPAFAMAQSTTTQTESNEGAVTPGGTSQDGALPIFGAGGIPAGAVVVAGVVILGGVIIGIVAATDDDDAAATTTTTN